MMLSSQRDNVALIATLAVLWSPKSPNKLTYYYYYYYYTAAYRSIQTVRIVQERDHGRSILRERTRDFLGRHS